MVTKKGVEVPALLAASLATDEVAAAVFERMRPSCQREYAGWVSEAKREATRERRSVKALERIRDYGRRHGWIE